jgi:hypothetical protein
MGFSQTLVAQDFATEPALLATKRAFHHKADLADGLVAGELPWAERLVLDSLILDAVFDAPPFQAHPVASPDSDHQWIPWHNQSTFFVCPLVQ